MSNVSPRGDSVIDEEPGLSKPRNHMSCFPYGVMNSSSYLFKITTLDPMNWNMRKIVHKRRKDNKLLFINFGKDGASSFDRCYW